ncbi:hypothetical protein R50076_35230 [Gilvimarinus japonicus]
MHLSSECARAMDNAWFTDQIDNKALEKTSNIHLITCHNYDMVRKKLLVSGVSDDLLAYLNLRALELNQHSAEDLVEQHRFKER